MEAQPRAQSQTPTTDAGLLNQSLNRARNPQTKTDSSPQNDIAIGTPLPFNLAGNQSSSTSQPQTTQGQLNQAQNQARVQQQNQAAAEEEQNEQDDTETDDKKQAKQKGKKKKKKKGLGLKSQDLTREILRWAWLTAIETYGITMVYVWFHLIMYYVAGAQKYFSPFGSIFYFKMGKIRIGDSKVAEYAEIIVALGVFLAIFVMILINLTMIGFFIFAANNTALIAWEVLKSIVAGFFSWLFGGSK